MMSVCCKAVQEQMNRKARERVVEGFPLESKLLPEFITHSPRKATD